MCTSHITGICLRHHSNVMVLCCHVLTLMKTRSILHHAHSVNVKLPVNRWQHRSEMSELLTEWLEYKHYVLTGIFHLVAVIQLYQLQMVYSNFHLYQWFCCG